MVGEIRKQLQSSISYPYLTTLSNELSVFCGLVPENTIHTFTSKRNKTDKNTHFEVHIPLPIIEHFKIDNPTIPGPLSKILWGIYIYISHILIIA